MQTLILFGIIGFLAQLIDGALGMAYGVTSATLLLAAGMSPALASASIHLAEVGTTLASGAAHWRFGNVDWPTVRRIALPGGVGAFLGATVLSHVDAGVLKAPVALFLLGLGVYVLVRFALLDTGSKGRRPPLSRRVLWALGAFAGFMDAAGGGGWGPIATPTLLASRSLEPRRVVGSVDTSELVVALAASAGFILGLGLSEIDWAMVGVLFAGGLIAAPLAAYLVRKVPPRMLGAAVGGLILVTNARTLLNALDLTGGASRVVYPLLFALWGGAIALAYARLRREPREQALP